MNVILFGATGMVGQGALRECLLDPTVENVMAIGRTPLAANLAGSFPAESGPTALPHPELREIVRQNLYDFSDVEAQLRGFDACFFCLGISSAGMDEAAYRRITRDIPFAAAQALLPQNPQMTFVFISGAGADSSERGRSMWARVKGQTENALLRMPFKAVYIFRPAFIQPLHGIRSKTKIYRLLYAILAPLNPLLQALLPKYVTTTEELGRAMIAVAKNGAPKQVLESADIRRYAGAAL